MVCKTISEYPRMLQTKHRARTPGRRLHLIPASCPKARVSPRMCSMVLFEAHRRIETRVWYIATSSPSRSQSSPWTRPVAPLIGRAGA
jgi:hypothetical protein